MKHEIKPAFVTPKQAEFLKDIGFNDWCKYRCTDFDGVIDLKENASSIFPYAPEQYQVVEWLRVNHEIWIEITYGKDFNSVWFDYNIFSLIKPRKDDLLGEDGIEYDDDPNEMWLNYETTYNSMIDDRFETFEKQNYLSPQKAYSAAFDYILENNLI